MDAFLTPACEQLARITAALPAPETLPPDFVAGSPDGARKTLRWLRNLEGMQEDTETWLLRGTPIEQGGKIQQLQQLIFIYAWQLREAHHKGTGIVRHTAIVDATSACGALAISCIEHVRDALPDHHPDIAVLDGVLDLLPESCDLRLLQPVERLLELLARGIERLTDTYTDEKTPVERLVELSNKIAATAHKLRSIDTLEEQPREESIELAREILRRLRNMKFSDKPIEEMMDASDIGEKAALAAELNDLTENYRNLLLEAALTDPNILQDARVLAANEAVEIMANSIKLLASREIPVTLAATQQISADITQSPEDWKALSGRTAERLTQSMEAGIEHAADELAQQQHQQQQEEQQALQQQQQEGQRRGKRKRRQQRSGAGGAKQRKQAADLTADDYVLKQGRFRENVGHDSVKIAAPAGKASSKGAKAAKETEQKFMQGLKPEDLEIVKQLGGSLKSLNKQANGLKPQDTKDSEKITPDDKGFAQRKTEQQQRDRDKPGGVKI